MKTEYRYLALAWISVLAMIAMMFLIMPVSWGRDLGQWSNVDPVISNWYKSLMMPDMPAVSCCGEADSYWCDDIHVKDGKTFCGITDDRSDEPLKREHIDVGTIIEIPDHKITWKDGNPTGHSVVFLSRGLFVWCFVGNSGT